MKNISNNQGSAISTTVFLLFGIVAIAMIGIEIVTSGLEAYRAQGSSSRAYYAAETGIERALTIFKVSPEKLYDDSNCPGGSYLYFKKIDLSMSSCVAVLDEGSTYHVGDDIENAEYWVKIDFEDPLYDVSGKERQVILTAVGHYLNTNRSIETRFCIPICEDGDDFDGCGGSCLIEEAGL